MDSLLIKRAIILAIALMAQQIVTFDCNLPNGCFLQPIKYSISLYNYEKSPYRKDAQQIKCKTAKGFQFNFTKNGFMSNESNETCTISENTSREKIVFEWPKTSELIIFDKNFHVSKMVEYFRYFKLYFEVNFVNLRGIDINLSNTNKSAIFRENTEISTIRCIGCTMNFYTKGKLIKSCRDILESNSNILSIFQIKMDDTKHFGLINNNYRMDLCPLIFKNADIEYLTLMGLVDSFYKKSVLKFTDDVFNKTFNSTIHILDLYKVEHINLNSKILNPYVFEKLREIIISGSVKSIDKNIFKLLPKLASFDFRPAYFRKLIHENGVDWINGINKNRKKVNLKNISDIRKKTFYIKNINIQCDTHLQEEPLFEVFPDEDFCVYKDFPFNKLVILMQYCEDLKLQIIKKTDMIKTEEFTCTYLWLIQYFEFFNKYNEFYNLTNDTMAFNIKKITESKTYKERSKCNFERRLVLCNKTNYNIENIWSTIDYYYLNKKLQSAFKIASYLISLFGIASNLLTVIIIVIKSNCDLFKEFKQYRYLCIYSVFSLMILAINILSWTTECFYPFEAFCPEIRKVVFFQFFKIIFKECFTTTFRFMLNFSYVAFALNRIAIIKKDQNKFLKFISEISIWAYIGVTLLISSVLSVIKYFKYEVNYEYPFMNYPISNEWDISSFHFQKKGYHTFDYVYFIMNSISDIFNYMIFVLICIFIDIYMVRQLRQIMTDKLQKIERLYADSKTKIENAKKENDEAMNNAIRMVVINTAIGILFKMPISFIPILNVYATFYYTNFKRVNYHLAFGRFYSSLFLKGFYSQISDLADFLFIISISIQPLIYKHFDKKFQIAFHRFFNKNQQQDNSLKSSKNTTKQSFSI